jgi:hypothetical protein
LSSQWLRWKSAQDASAVAQLPQALEHPLVRRAFPPDRVERIGRRWTEREKFLDALDRLPQTLCHYDTFRRNLFARRTPSGFYQTIAIDWALVGVGAIGQEIFNLIRMSLIEFDDAHVKELDRIVFEGYLNGLHDAGWQGDPRQARLGQIAREAMNLEGLPYLLPIYLDESRHAWYEQTTGLSIEEEADLWAERSRHSPLGHWEEEAWELLDELW